MRIRRPAVAGAFYEAERERLRTQVDYCFTLAGEPETDGRWIAAVVPHAGLMYSGGVAASFYARARMPRSVILLGPNHTGTGAAVAVDPSDAWATPFGLVPVAAALREEILRESSLFESDASAHRFEHSLEVQLPFLGADISVVPISIGECSYAVCEEVGTALAAVLTRHPSGVGLVASSDLNHYEDQQTTLAKDRRALDRILALDAAALFRTVLEEGISMCGVLPVTAAIVAARIRGANEAILLKHATSGDASGDYRSVVGYASILIR